ncbi:MAG: phospho-sugar mutase [Bacteroidota bacterium]|nr:phospho-sugar mutase [Bacteroidota bacterium]MDX5506227.1 phospho-sugar mutase [Bacteroidota bacterium]
MQNPTVDEMVLERARTWLSNDFDTATRDTVRNMIESDPKELTECFYKELEFGTGGMRGLMGVGTNRINRYTLGMASQGYANFLKKKFPIGEINVAIAHDSRNYSKEFSREVAGVFAANGIKVFLFEDLRPTPELSFAIRHLNCHGGAVLTASHNPKEYNGFKVYGDDGGQLVPPEDKQVIDEIRKVELGDVLFDGPESLIEVIGSEVDEAYLRQLKTLSRNKEGRKDLKVVFTALHGTGAVLLPDAFRDWGFDLTVIDEQMIPDGNFPTVISPNPEEAAALDMAVRKAEELGADMVIGNDPDADRVGIAVKDDQGRMRLLNGNQTAIVLFYYLLMQDKKAGKLKGREFIAKTIVTTDLLDVIAEHFGVSCRNCYTGFKWIAEMIRENEGINRFIVGGEESYGYLIGDFVRDKDAIGSALILAEIAAWAKSKGSSFYQMLLDIYTQFGLFQERTISLTRKGKAGSEEIARMMEDLRSAPPTQLDGEKIIAIRDYRSGQTLNPITRTTETIPLTASNVIQLETYEGTKLTARPSGTEPKIKFYISVRSSVKDTSGLKQLEIQLNQKIDRIVDQLDLR